MPKKRFTDEQIAFALREADSGTRIGEICRKIHAPASKNGGSTTIRTDLAQPSAA